MMFEMSTLVGGQSRAADEGPPTILVPVLPADPRTLSYVVATELNVQPNVKQELLEYPSALARLQKEAEILAEETPQLQERLSLQVRRRFSSFGMSS
jgi:hypothetical protein